MTPKLFVLACKIATLSCEAGSDQFTFNNGEVIYWLGSQKSLRAYAQQDELYALAKEGMIDYRGNQNGSVLQPAFDLLKNTGETHNYAVNQAGAVGPSAIAQGNTFVQLNLSDADLGNLAGELARLRKHLKSVASEPEHDADTGFVAEAEMAAKKGDAGGVVASFKKLGSWGVKQAKDFGSDVIAKTIERLAKS